MQTIKLPYITNQEGIEYIYELRRTQSSLIRSAFKLFEKGVEVKDMQKNTYLKDTFNVSSWLKQCGIIEAKAIYDSKIERDKVNKEVSKLVFGGSKLFQKRIQGLITKEEFQAKRLCKLNVIGETLQKGNRFFTLNISEGTILFKPGRNHKFSLVLPKLRRNYTKLLADLELSSKNCKSTFSVKLDENFIYISFEKVKSDKYKKKEILPTDSHVLGIDMNPEKIGISILKKDSKQIVFTKEYNFKEITSKIINNKLPNTDNYSKHLVEKLNYEIIQVSKDIEKIAIHFSVKAVVLEDLKFKVEKKPKKKNHKKKKFNRLTKNLWNRNLFTNNLKKRCSNNKIQFITINPAYSSIIGNLMYDFTDPINASIEIVRRGCDVVLESVKEKRQFYPNFKPALLKDQWKEHFGTVDSWGKIFELLKNSDLRYRVFLPDLEVFSLKHNKSLVKYHICT